MASSDRLYSDLDSGDDDGSQDSRNTTDNAAHVDDEMEEGRFFAGVFMSQRAEEDLVGYVESCPNDSTIIHRRLLFLPAF
jgi:hypothetical protein